MINALKLLRPIWLPITASVRNYSYPKLFVHHIKNLPKTETTTLPNGLTVATESRECYNVCIGLFIDAGSRYESQYNNGIGHFFEHIAFKGTCTRTKEALEAQMSCTGAHFKCFTTREMVVYYAECLCEDVPLITDLLTDCIYNNCLSATEIEEQKRVVYTEMYEQDHDINVLLNDYLHATAFQGTPLAQSVVGPSINLYNFCAPTIKRYLEKFFNPRRTVLAAVGGITHDQIVQLAQIYLGKLEPMMCFDGGAYRYSGSQVLYRNDELPMANVALAFEGPCFCDEDNYTMKVASAILGGWDRTMFAGLDHAHLIACASAVAHDCVGYKAFNINYKDTGLWGVQFLSSGLTIDDMIYTVQDQFMKLCTMVTEPEVAKARRLVKAKLLKKTESAMGACMDMGRWILYNGYRPPLSERFCTYDKVTASEVKSTCYKYVYDKCPVVAAVGPTENVPDYNRIRTGQYWVRW